jgi:hypothetical protein
MAQPMKMSIKGPACQQGGSITSKGETGMTNKKGSTTG